MILELDMFLTSALAVILLVVGGWVRNRVEFLRTFCIPVPVVGGIIFTTILLIGHVSGLFAVEFDMVLSDFFMLIFYTSVGFTASIPLLRQGGIDTVKFLILSTVLVVLQNLVGFIGAKALNINPLIGLATSSIPMTGGHGTSAVFAPELVKLGLENAHTIALAAATFGLVSGALVGGPVGRYLIERRLKGKAISEADEGAYAEKEEAIMPELEEITNNNLYESTLMMFFAMALGTLISKGLGMTGLVFPASVGGMLASALLVNINPKGNKFRIHLRELAIMGNIALAIFLALSMMKLKLWEIGDLALPMLILLGLQVLLAILFAVFIDFKIMGGDYEAAIISAGHCGFGLGAVPTAMANMQTLTERYGPAPKSYFIVPLVGSLFINVANTFVITIFMNLVA